MKDDRRDKRTVEELLRESDQKLDFVRTQGLAGINEAEEDLGPEEIETRRQEIEKDPNEAPPMRRRQDADFVDPNEAPPASRKEAGEVEDEKAETRRQAADAEEKAKVCRRKGDDKAADKFEAQARRLRRQAGDEPSGIRPTRLRRQIADAEKEAEESRRKGDDDEAEKLEARVRRMRRQAEEEEKIEAKRRQAEEDEKAEAKRRQAEEDEKAEAKRRQEEEDEKAEAKRRQVDDLEGGTVPPNSRRQDPDKMEDEARRLRRQADEKDEKAVVCRRKADDLEDETNAARRRQASDDKEPEAAARRKQDAEEKDAESARIRRQAEDLKYEARRLRRQAEELDDKAIVARRRGETQDEFAGSYAGRRQDDADKEVQESMETAAEKMAAAAIKRGSDQDKDKLKEKFLAGMEKMKDGKPASKKGKEDAEEKEFEARRLRRKADEKEAEAEVEKRRCDKLPVGRRKQDAEDAAADKLSDARRLRRQAEELEKEARRLRREDDKDDVNFPKAGGRKQDDEAPESELDPTSNPENTFPGPSLADLREHFVLEATGSWKVPALNVSLAEKLGGNFQQMLDGMAKPLWVNTIEKKDFRSVKSAYVRLVSRPRSGPRGAKVFDQVYVYWDPATDALAARWMTQDGTYKNAKRFEGVDDLLYWLGRIDIGGQWSKHGSGREVAEEIADAIKDLPWVDKTVIETADGYGEQNVSVLQAISKPMKGVHKDFFVAVRNKEIAVGMGVYVHGARLRAPLTTAMGISTPEMIHVEGAKKRANDTQSVVDWIKTMVGKHFSPDADQMPEDAAERRARRIVEAGEEAEAEKEAVARKQEAEKTEAECRRLRRQAEADEAECKRLRRQAEDEEDKGRRLRRQAGELKDKAEELRRQAEEEKPKAYRRKSDDEKFETRKQEIADKENEVKRLRHEAEEAEVEGRRLRRQEEEKEAGVAALRRQADEKEKECRRCTGEGFKPIREGLNEDKSAKGQFKEEAEDLKLQVRRLRREAEELEDEAKYLRRQAEDEAPKGRKADKSETEALEKEERAKRLRRQADDLEKDAEKPRRQDDDDLDEEKKEVSFHTSDGDFEVTFDPEFEAAFIKDNKKKESFRVTGSIFKIAKVYSKVRDLFKKGAASAKGVLELLHGQGLRMDAAHLREGHEVLWTDHAAYSLCEHRNADDVIEEVLFGQPKLEELFVPTHLRECVREVERALSEGWEFIDEKVMVKVVNPGILEVPKGEKVWNLPESHFRRLIKKKGQKAVMLALLNLERWNKGREGRSHIASWAREMIDKVKLGAAAPAPAK